MSEPQSRQDEANRWSGLAASRQLSRPTQVAEGDHANHSGGSCLLAGGAFQQIRKPSAGRVLFAEREGRDDDRYSDEGAGDPPHEGPEKHREQHQER